MRHISRVSAATALLLCAGASHGQVFLNEIFINPPGSTDATREFIEIHGTPGRRLDGYAVAVLNGTQAKYFPLGTIPPTPLLSPEIDEFFSLDGLRIGANGLLVIARGTQANYPTLLADTAFQRWNTIWNGGLDTPGGLENDGSNTVMLIRRRPGRTQADPANPLGLRWGKDIDHDFELITPVIDPQSGQLVDQFGNGSLDRGQPNGMGGFTLDMVGASTPDDPADDLEVVDEVSYEHERGWEYDTDGRRVDAGSTHPGLPGRRVHALDDPQGFNPDALTRVDYRTKGPGWTPAPGAVGDGPGGNNWQDAATEQWIRGESITDPNPLLTNSFYSIEPNTNPDAIQPFRTNVPTWLADGAAPDFDFTNPTGYQIMAGRVNPLAVPFIPGDANRDGVTDGEDIAKIAAVFGNDDWIFSNAFAAAPEGNSGDPAAQTRPWDVDATGENGVEPSDLQWAIEFQGSADGRILGVRYDSPTPSPTGVALNPNTGVSVTLSFEPSVLSGRPLGALVVGDVVEITVRAAVAGPARPQGQENGLTQAVHDLVLSAPGVLRVINVEPVGPFAPTRAEIQALQGSDGDLGVRNLNVHTTSITQGVAAPAPLYRVRLQAVGEGSASAALSPAAMPKFVASTPHGVKVARTRNASGPFNANIGNPAGAQYLAALTLTVGAGGGADCNGNGVPDEQEIAANPALDCFDPSASGVIGGPDGILDVCQCPANWNRDSAVNSSDLSSFITSWLAAVSTSSTGADIDCSGATNSSDLSAFITRWLSSVTGALPYDGCP